MVFWRQWLVLLCLQHDKFVFGQSTPDETAYTSQRYEPSVLTKAVNLNKALKGEHYSQIPSQFVVLLPMGRCNEDNKNSQNIVKEKEIYKHPDFMEQLYQPSMSGDHNLGQINKAIKEVYYSKEAPWNENKDGNRDEKTYPDTNCQSAHERKHYTVEHIIPYNTIIMRNALKLDPNNLEIKHASQKPQTSVFKSEQNYQRSDENSYIPIFQSRKKDFGINNKITPVNNAFLTKFTTYNITKILDNKEEKGYILEKKVNYSTSLNYLDSKHRHSNYTDTHVSTLQTVLEQSGDEKKPHDYALLRNVPANNIFSPWSLEEPTNKQGEMLSKPSNLIGPNVATDFVNGQFVKTTDEGDDLILGSPDSDLCDKLPVNFESGQFVQMSHKSCHGLDLLNTGKEVSKGFDAKGLVGDRGKTYDSSDQSKHEDGHKVSADFVGGQFVEGPRKTEHIDKELQTLSMLETTTNIASEIPVLASKDNPTSSSIGQINENTDDTDENNAGYVIKVSHENNGSYINVTNVNSEILSTGYEVGIKNEVNALPEEYSLPKPNTEYRFNKGMSPSSVYQTESVEIIDKELSQNNTEFQRSDINDSNNISSKTNFSEFNNPIRATTNKNTLLSSEDTSTIGILSENINNYPSHSIIPTSKEQVVFEANDGNVDVIVTVSQKQESLAEDKEHKVEFQYTTLRSEVDSENTPEKIFFNYDDYEKVLPTAKPISEIQSVITDSDEYIESSNAILGISNMNGNEGILEKDPETGHYVTEMVGEILPNYVTETSNIQDSVSEDAQKRGDIDVTELLPNASEVDNTMGDYSDVLIQLKSHGNSSHTVVTDNENILVSNNKMPEENSNTTEIMDHVELFAGVNPIKTYINELSNSKLDKTENTKYSLQEETSKNPTQTLKINVGDCDEEHTNICFPLTNKTALSLLDLLSGHFYPERNVINKPQLPKLNPMKNCISPLKKHSPSTNVPDNSKTLKTQTIVDVNDDEINKESFLKSKSEKRHVTEGDIHLVKPESKTGRLSKEEERESSNKTVIHNTEKDLSFQHISDYMMEAHLKHQLKTLKEKENSDSIDHTLDKHTHLEDKSFKVDPSIVLQTLPRKLDISLLTNKNDLKSSSNRKYFLESNINKVQVPQHGLNFPENQFDFRRNTYGTYEEFNKKRFPRTIIKKSISEIEPGHKEECGCDNGMLQSPSPVPGPQYFVGKRFNILKNIVHAVKNWVVDTQ